MPPAIPASEERLAACGKAAIADQFLQLLQQLASTASTSPATRRRIRSTDHPRPAAGPADDTWVLSGAGQGPAALPEDGGHCRAAVIEHVIHPAIRGSTALSRLCAIDPTTLFPDAPHFSTITVSASLPVLIPARPCHLSEFNQSVVVVTGPPAIWGRAGGTGLRGTGAHLALHRPERAGIERIIAACQWWRRLSDQSD